MYTLVTPYEEAGIVPSFTLYIYINHCTGFGAHETRRVLAPFVGFVNFFVCSVCCETQFMLNLYIVLNIYSVDNRS